MAISYTTKELQERSDRLAKMEYDARLDLLEAMGEKISELAQQMRNSTIEFTDKDDKAFDRTMKTMVESKTISDNYKYLRLEIGITKDTGDSGRVENPLEARAKGFSGGKVSERRDREGEGKASGKAGGGEKGTKILADRKKGGFFSGGGGAAAAKSHEDGQGDADPF